MFPPSSSLMFKDIEPLPPLTLQSVETMEKGKELSSAFTGNILSSYKDKPVEFAKEKLGLYLTVQQEELLIHVRDNRHTNVQSCHSVGKTISMAVLLLYWVFCVGGFVVTTAPTKWQVKDQLWQQVLLLYEEIEYEVGGQLDATQLKVNGKLKALGFASSKTSKNTNQGFHHSRLLIIVEEACGISDAVDKGLSSCLTGSENRMVRVGNPVDPNTKFFEHCSRSHIRLSAWEHPNVSWAYELCEDGVHRLKPSIAEKVLNPDGTVKDQDDWEESLPRDVIDGAISIQWLEEVARPSFVEGSASWFGRVEGLFPEDAMDVLIPMSSLKAARARFDADPSKWIPDADVIWRWGMDVGDGGDPSAFAGWRGSCLMRAWELPGLGDLEDVNRCGDEGVRIMKEYGGILAGDRAGVGAGAVGVVKREFRRRVIGVHWASAPNNYEYRPDEYLYSILKAQHFWAFREILRLGNCAIAPLGAIESKAFKELSSIKYKIDAKDQIVIQSKDDIQKPENLGWSPNLAEAIVLGLNAKPRGGRLPKT